MKNLKRVFALLLCGIVCGLAAGQQKINPNTGINWPLATGSGAPTSSCTSVNYGQPYLDVAAQNSYVCSSTGWIIVGGGGPSTGAVLLQPIGGALQKVSGPLDTTGYFSGGGGATGTPLGYSFDLTAFGDSISSSFPLEHVEDDFVYRFGKSINTARVYVSGQVGGMLANAWGGIFNTVSTTYPGKTTIISHELGINDSIQSGFVASYAVTAYSATGGTLTLTANNNFTPGQTTILVGSSSGPLASTFGTIWTVQTATSTQFTISTSLITGSGATNVHAASANQTQNYALDVAASAAYMEYQGTPYYAQLFGYTPAANLSLSLTGTWSHPSTISGSAAEPGEVCTSASCTVQADFTGSALYVTTGMSNTYSPSISSSVVCDGVSQSVPLYFYGFAGEPIDTSGPNQLGLSRFPLSFGTHNCVITVATGGDVQFLVAPAPAYAGRVLLVNEITPNISTFSFTEAYSSALFRPTQAAAVTMLQEDGAVNVGFVPQGTAFPAIPSNFNDGVLHPSSAMHDVMANLMFTTLKSVLGIAGKWNYTAYLGNGPSIPGPTSQGVGNFNFGGGSLRTLILDTNALGSTFNTACEDALTFLQSGDFNTACGAQTLGSLTGYPGSASAVNTISLANAGTSCNQGDILTVGGGDGKAEVQALSVNSSGAITTLAVVPGTRGTTYSPSSGVGLTGITGVTCTGATINILTVGSPPAHSNSNVGYGSQALGAMFNGQQNTAVGTAALSLMNGGGGRFTAFGYDALEGYNPYVASTLEKGGTALGYDAGLSAASSNFTLGIFHLPTTGETDNNFTLTGQFAGKATSFVLIDDIDAFGQSAEVMNDDSGEFGTGKNAYAHTFAFRGASVIDDAGNFNAKLVNTTASVLASAATITPTSGLVSISGTTAITTITPPTIQWGNPAVVNGRNPSTYSASGGVLTITAPAAYSPAIINGQSIQFFTGPTDPLFSLSGITFTLNQISTSSFSVNTNLLTGSGTTTGGFINQSSTGPLTGCIQLIATAAWSLATGGNIASAYTPSVGSSFEICYNPATSLWYPPTNIAASSFKATTPSLGGSLVSVGCANQTAVTVTGATTGMTCSMSGTAGNPANIQPQCSVSAANTVIPQLCTAIALGVTPTAQTYNIRVIP